MMVLSLNILSHADKSDKVAVLVEPEKSSVVVILYLACKLYSSRVTVMMTSSSKFSFVKLSFVY